MNLAHPIRMRLSSSVSRASSKLNARPSCKPTCSAAFFTSVSMHDAWCRVVATIKTSSANLKL
eukprot:4224451-Karenia_brevis.AAC.1